MRELTPDEAVIYHILKTELPGSFYVTPDGNYIYLIAIIGGEEGLLHFERVSPGKTFLDLDEDELNEVIQDYLDALFED